MKLKYLWQNCILIAGLLVVSRNCVLAQRAQDNWYLWQTWTNNGANYSATNGGLSSPYGVAIGPDGRIYVGDQDYGLIQVYLASGAYSYSITNGFGGGQSFSAPRGMITDTASNLYVADAGNNCVFEFSGNGTFIRKIGGVTGSAPGQLSGVMDVAVSTSGQVYIVENGNSRVSSFNPDGTFNSILINSGSLSSQLDSPVSIAISDSGEIFVTQDYTSYQGRQVLGSGFRMLKAFDTNGVSLFHIDLSYVVGYTDPCQHNGATVYLGPCSVRIDRSGLVHVINSSCGTYYEGCNDPTPNFQMTWSVFNLDGSQVTSYPISFGYQSAANLYWPCQAVGPDGTMVIADQPTVQLQQFLYAKRELDPVPRNAPSMPEVLGVQQRTNSTIVDIYYQVNDMDDTNTFAGMLVFTNGTQSLSDCIQPLSFTEGTGTNINTTIPANQPLHVTWNAGADWPATNNSNYRVAIIAKDNRQGLLDVHYLKLPADRSMPALQISASPLIQSDFAQVWWWLLATNDPGIRLSNSVIYGVGGTYDGLALCDGDNNTTTNGQVYIYAKMNVRQATAAEVSWASQGPNANITNKWTPTISVNGRPSAVNDYGFDTGNWGANAWWIVPLQ